MTSFSYTVSAELRSNLQKIDDRRVKILITRLNPKTELKLRWETMLDSVYYSLLLSNSPLSRSEMRTILTSSLLKKPKKLTAEERTVMKYKKAIDIISQNWLMSDKLITPKTVVMLHEVGCVGSYKNKDTELKQILDFLQTTNDHPVVKAGIVYAAVSGLHPFSDGNARISRLLSKLFLYKAGYDVRGMVCIEQAWAQNPEEFKKALKQGISNIHMTNWIEYYARTYLNQLNYKQLEIAAVKPASDRERNLFYLNERQKGILTLVEAPNSSITNRDVQSHFETSQITASRDLARMATLGLLIPHGHGRSVYYTRV